MEQLLPWILKLGSGAIGGNLAGSVLKKFSLGKLGNTIVGVLGGGLGAQLLGMLGLFGGGGADASALDLTNILGSVAGGTAGGGVLMTVVGMVKGMLGGGSKAE